MLVEDNLINQKVAARLLERLGCSVQVATNGVEALAQLRRNRFDLVFMDCHMPEMDGFETTLAVRGEDGDSGRHMPIIAMTAGAMAGDRESCLAAGMDDLYRQARRDR